MTIDAGSKQGRNNGRFAKGYSGNPAGRKMGKRTKATVLAEAAESYSRA
jgi:Family of unknown function (DUF5681)